MSRSLRIFLRILCAVLACLMLASCNPSVDSDPDDDEIEEEEQGGKETDKDDKDDKETENPAKETDPDTDPVGEDPETQSETDPTPAETTDPYDVGTWPSRNEKEVDLYNNGYNNNLIVGFDEYGRTVSAVGAERADKEVGMFYFTWLGAETSKDIYDMTKIREQYGDDVLYHQNVDVSPEGAFHWWGEPLYGYYASGDEWVIRKHMEMLTSAGVDFLVFDTTNAFTYTATAKRVMGVISELRAEGWDAPQVCFFTHSYAIQTMNQLYRDIYEKDVYPDTWYRVNGKPMIIGYTKEADDKAAVGDPNYNPGDLSKELRDFFYVREARWPHDPLVANGWSFIEWSYPQPLNTDMINVAVASHPGVPFSNSISVSGWRDRNWGRGWNVTTKTNVTADINRGTFFQSQWETVFDQDPRFIMITGWNEWIAIKNPDGSGNYMFVDCADIEFSRDIEPMKGGYEDAYYIQTMTNIRKYANESLDGKIAKTVKKVIDVNGAATQWDDVNAIYRRIGTDDGKRNARDAARKNWYKQDPARNNLVEVRVTVDSENVYFYIKATEDIVLSDDANWMNIFIGKGSTPNSRKGWEGYEYVINRSRENGKASIEKLNADYTGKTLVAKAEYSVQGNVMQVSVPRATLGVTDAEDFFFKVADGVEDPAEIMNYYASGRSMPMGRLSYLYQIGNAD